MSHSRAHQVLVASPKAAEPFSVLVIDDSCDSLKLVDYVLEPLVEERYYASSGLQGVALTQTIRPRLILLDIILPDISGYDLMQLLKSDPNTSDIPVVAMTALALAGDRRDILQAGFDHYLLKPFRIERLEELVMSYQARVG